MSVHLKSKHGNVTATVSTRALVRDLRESTAKILGIIVPRITLSANGTKLKDPDSLFDLEIRVQTQEEIEMIIEPPFIIVQVREWGANSDWERKRFKLSSLQFEEFLWKLRSQVPKLTKYPSDEHINFVYSSSSTMRKDLGSWGIEVPRDDQYIYNTLKGNSLGRVVYLRILPPQHDNDDVSTE